MKPSCCTSKLKAAILNACEQHHNKEINDYIKIAFTDASDDHVCKAVSLCEGA